MEDNYDFFDDFNFGDDSDFGFEEDDIFLDLLDDEEDIVSSPQALPPKKRLIEGLTLEYAEFFDRTFTDLQLGHFMFYNVTFRNCTFDHIDCQCGKFIACTFEDCNIISFSGEGYGFRECEFTRCKWSGNECIDDCFYYSNCKYTDCEENYDR